MQLKGKTMSKLPRISVNIVGVVAIIVALGGLIYNGISLSFAQSGAYSDLIKQQKLSYFYQAFYAMSGICIICYVIILLSGIALIRKRDSWSIILTGVLIFEVIYFLANSLFLGIVRVWFQNECCSCYRCCQRRAHDSGGDFVSFMGTFPLEVGKKENNTRTSSP